MAAVSKATPDRQTVAVRAKRRAELSALIDAEMPFAGPCGICGGPDKRHRVLDAVADCVRAGDSVASVAEAYGLSAGLVSRLAEDWDCAG